MKPGPRRTQNKQRILVVVPVFNRSALVLEALDSIGRQTRAADEIIIIDDGSTDATPQTVAQWIKDHPAATARLISTPNQGAAAARNQAYASAKQSSDFVAFLDSDDIWPADFLQRVVAALTAQPDAVLAIADREFRHLDNRTNLLHASAALAVDPLLYMLRHGTGVASASLIRSSDFDACGGFSADVPTGHDVRPFTNLSDAGKWVHLPGAPVIYRVGFVKSLPSQEPHLSRRYKDWHVRWAEAFSTVMEQRPPFARTNRAREIRYHAKLMDRYFRVFLIEARSLRFANLPRCWRGLWHSWQAMQRTKTGR